MMKFAKATLTAAAQVILVCATIVLAGCNGDSATANTSSSNTSVTTTTPTPPNDNIVLTNARFYTVNDALPEAAALAYNKEGVIIAVGSDADVKAAAGEGATVRDLQGAFVMPGFQDLHGHIIEAGLEATRCVVDPSSVRAQIEDDVLECVLLQPNKDWVFGSGVRVEELRSIYDDPAAALDALVPDKPAVFLDAVGHGAWANSMALDAVGYTKENEDPQGAIIDRFEDGTPTGVVYENGQQRLRTAALPPTEANLEENYQGLLIVLKTLAENGITTVGDAGGYWPRGHEKAWVRAEDNGEMTVRASNTLYVFPDRDYDAQLAEIMNRKTTDANRLVQFDQVKIYVDGIPEFGTAAMYEPYSRNPGVVSGYPLGFEYFDRQELKDYSLAFDKAGFQIYYHATGDRGVGLALDMVAEIRALNASTQAHRITHCIIVDDRDNDRFKSLNVVADLQISPATTNPADIPFYDELIGARSANLYPVGSLLAAGADVILSSDWSADELPPLQKLEAAVTRNIEAVPDLATAVRLMTINPARLIGNGDLTGSLEVGKYADIVVLDQDIFSVAPASIDETRVLGTIMGGRVVFDRNSLLK
ncbi:MAG: amidohydrolase [Kordiimonas sp.]